MTHPKWLILVSAAFIWTKNAGMTSLGMLPGGDASEASDINNAGWGASSVKSGEKHAFLWTSGNGMQDLGTLPGDISSHAYRISNSGLVIGSSSGPIAWGPRIQSSAQPTMGLRRRLTSMT
jgi:probable HAF family extracellular repeat protein